MLLSTIILFALIPLSTLIVSDYTLHSTYHLITADNLLSSASSPKSVPFTSDILTLALPSSFSDLIVTENQLLPIPSSTAVSTTVTPSRTNICFFSDSSFSNVIPFTPGPVCPINDSGSDESLTSHFLQLAKAFFEYILDSLGPYEIFLKIVLSMLANIVLQARREQRWLASMAAQQPEQPEQPEETVAGLQATASHDILPEMLPLSSSELTIPIVTATEAEYEWSAIFVVILLNNRAAIVRFNDLSEFVAAPSSITSMMSLPNATIIETGLEWPIIRVAVFRCNELMDVVDFASIDDADPLDPARAPLPTAVSGELDINPIDVPLPDAIPDELDIDPAYVPLPDSLPGELDAPDMTSTDTSIDHNKLLSTTAVLPGDCSPSDGEVSLELDDFRTPVAASKLSSTSAFLGASVSMVTRLGLRSSAQACSKMICTTIPGAPPPAALCRVPFADLSNSTLASSHKTSASSPEPDSPCPSLAAQSNSSLPSSSSPSPLPRTPLFAPQSYNFSRGRKAKANAIKASPAPLVDSPETRRQPSAAFRALGDSMRDAERRRVADLEASASAGGKSFGYKGSLGEHLETYMAQFDPWVLR